MARKNLLTSVTAGEVSTTVHEVRSQYASKGASRSMILSIEEMAENAKKMIAGESIVELPAELIDASFVSDRISDDDEELGLLRDGISREGQLQPVLVRPHPDVNGRFMIVFGHRRVRAARDLGLPVRAVIKDLEEIAHIIAQGQENSRRSNLSFIEKALFAKKLQSMGQTKDTIKAALSVDDSLLSRMLSIAEIVPYQLVITIGAAKSVGRDRWEELKKLLTQPSNVEAALDLIKSDDFGRVESERRFDYVLAQVKALKKSARKRSNSGSSGAWAADDKLVAANFRSTGKTFSLSLKSKDASEFGHFLSSNLESLYRDFKQTKIRN